jgi:hypothetical protein
MTQHAGTVGGVSSMEMRCEERLLRREKDAMRAVWVSSRLSSAAAATPLSYLVQGKKRRRRRRGRRKQPCQQQEEITMAVVLQLL